MKLLCIIGIATFIFQSCQSLEKQSEKPIGNSGSYVFTDTSTKYAQHPFIPLSKELAKEEVHPDVLPVMGDAKQAIRDNFKRINAITHWSGIKKTELWESTEGGEATFLFSNDTLQKMIVRRFGEMGQSLTEYYLLDGKLSFVYKKFYQYNRPIYYDSAQMVEDHDVAFFDFNKSVIKEQRFYVSNGFFSFSGDKIDDTDMSDTDPNSQAKRIHEEFDNIVILVK